jgi:hypothetical protein
MATQDVAHSLVTDGVSQFLQLALNAPIVLAGQTHHQPLDFPIGPWPPSWMAASLGPLEPDQLLVPTENSGGFHDPNRRTHGFDRAPRLGFQLRCQYDRR